MGAGWGVRGPPVGADKDGGGTIWVVSLSAAAMQHFLYIFPFAFIDKCFYSAPTHAETKREEDLVMQRAGFTEVIREL